MAVLKIPQSECGKVAKAHIVDALHDIGYIIIEKPIAIVHSAIQVDKEVCETYGYDIYESFNNGGTILANVGDIMFSHIGSIENNWIFRFAEYFTKWLKEKNLNAKFIDNDVLVDGHKVCGICITRYGKIDFSSGFVGVNTNLEHIKKICRKPMKKIPKGLSDYGITTEEIEQMFLEFCKTECDF